MPRKTRRTWPARSPPARFNEAAARCRGKQGRRPGGRDGENDASMRPRPDAAENRRLPRAGLAQRPASMRPRPDAAENGHHQRKEDIDPGLASMRPWPDAAENVVRVVEVEVGEERASMRPRPDAAENESKRRWNEKNPELQ